ncbi:hypothetical protein B0H13DRAFT_2550029 [Mycena leptocephala]|nr:hypothetical protein B0H13DRAFT_2550029 [Mycena leptocephala]
MAPIRIALIGLSASATTSWPSPLPALPPRSRTFPIVALSTAAPRAAVSAFHLPPETRAYGRRAHGGRVAPAVRKLKEVLEEGRIGKIVSAEVRAAGGLNNREMVPQGLTRREVGGNVFNIGFGHRGWDQIQFVHGDATVIQSRLHLQFPRVTPPRTRSSRPSRPTSRTSSSSSPNSNAAAPSAFFPLNKKIIIRRGQPAFDEPPLVWSITGETGDIRLSSSTVGARFCGGGDGDSSCHASHDGDRRRARGAHRVAVGRVAEGCRWWAAAAALYEAFAFAIAGADRKEGYPTFEDALKRHEQLEGMLVAWDEQTQSWA